MIDFLETVKMGSFTKAAERLHIQQPSLREAIINLENEMGEELFYRSKKGVELTEYGRYCLPHFQLIHESYEKMKQKKDYPLKFSSQLNIEVQSNYETFLALFYNTLTPKLKDVEIRINTNDNIDSITNRIMQNKTNLAFVLQDNKSCDRGLYHVLQEHNDIESSIIDSFEIVVLMKKNHPLAEKNKIDYEDLFKYKLVMSTVGMPSLAFLNRKIDINELDVIKTGSWKLVESYLGSQNAIAFTARGANNNDEFVTRPLEDTPMLTWSALYKKSTMDENILRSINVMKLAVSNYL